MSIQNRRASVSVGLSLLALAGLLIGCAAPSTPAADATDIPVVAQDESRVSTEAVIEPARWSALAFPLSGDVVEVRVQEGDAVAAGDELARLDTTDLERAVARAELALAQARLRLERLQEPADEADLRQAENAVSRAAAALRAAQLNVAAVGDSALLNEALEDARRVYDESLRQYEFRLQQYRSGEQPDYWYVNEAQEQLDDARLALDRVQQGGSVQLQGARNELLGAQLAHQEAQDHLARLQQGADEHDLASAELDVQSAELALAEARDNLERAVLRAPFAGTVTQLDLDPGDAAVAGQPVLTLATLDRLQARTVDLTELDVARVQAGQPVDVTVDALPGQTFAGVVSAIALQAQDYRGDVIYAVTVDLDAGGESLRWGMTAVAEIGVE